MNDTNKIIGDNLKRFRLKQKMSQSALGKVLGVSFQQIQKYEKGTNKIPIDKLIKILIQYKRRFQYFIKDRREQ